MVVANTVAGAAGCAASLCGMSRTPFDELVHRVNNLLGTIEIQAEVAKADGTAAAYADAMTKIVESARRTQDDVRRLRELAKERPPS